MIYLLRSIFVLVNTVELTAVKTALLISENHGLQYLFVIPAVAILASAIYVALLMPETHGLSLKQIGEIYSKGEVEVGYNQNLLRVILTQSIISHVFRTHYDIMFTYNLY